MTGGLPYASLIVVFHFSPYISIKRRKSQIQTYLEQNEGAGLQHLALKTDDIFKTISLMREAEEEFGGFELMRRPSDEYFQELPDRLGDRLTVSRIQRNALTVDLFRNLTHETLLAARAI